MPGLGTTDARNQTLTESLRSAGNVLYGGGAIEFVPGKGPALDGALQGAEQNERKDLAIGKALQPDLAEQPGIFAGFGLAALQAKAIAEARKSITRNAPKKISRRWKLAGSVDSG
jgi:hypothetical protein